MCSASTPATPFLEHGTLCPPFCLWDPNQGSSHKLGPFWNIRALFVGTPPFFPLQIFLVFTLHPTQDVSFPARSQKALLWLRSWLFFFFSFLYDSDLLEKEMATHSSILAREIPWSEERGRL